MAYCIGVDEAGYGPRLGPLVISASLWQLPGGLKPEQMYGRLSHLIDSKPVLPGTRSRSAAPGTDRPMQTRRFGRSACGSSDSAASTDSVFPADCVHPSHSAHLSDSFHSAGSSHSSHSSDSVHTVDSARRLSDFSRDPSGFAHSCYFGCFPYFSHPSESERPVDSAYPVDFPTPADPDLDGSSADFRRTRLAGTGPHLSVCHPAGTTQSFAPLVVADSKLVYRRQGRAGLERTVLVMLAGTDKRPTDWTELVKAVAFDPESQASALGWYAPYWPRVPESLLAEQVAPLAEWVAHGMAEQGIRLLRLWSMLIFPERFNRLVQQYGNKATMLSCQSLELVRGILATLPAGPVQVLCDKHGGRDKYEHLLAEKFAVSFLQPSRVKSVRQSRQESIYQVHSTNGPVDFRFLCGGEALMPVALASMLSKYLRELAMEAWNRFWAEQSPGIRPTAGYPLDARRFRAEIAARQAALGIPDSAIWRCR